MVDLKPIILKGFSMKKVNIGIIGFGTVGSGVYNLLKDNGSIIQDRTGLQIEIKAICDTRKDIMERATNGITLTDKWEDIVNNDEIDIVVELIGGITPCQRNHSPIPKKRQKCCYSK